LEIAIGPAAPVGNGDIEMQDPTGGITRKRLMTILSQSIPQLAEG